ncbi:DUF2490 domain-containing protein [Segetibacter sp. 3557_3]|nr:DUF2490 domain-containing protein [Segetibacter sp. 3557_3]
MVANLSNAQGRLSDHNTIGWYTTTITPRINDKVSGHIEYQWRRNKLVKDWQQSLLRVGLNYKLNPNVTFHVGYGWIETFAYGEYPIAAVPKRFPEHRIYEQVVINAPLGKASLLHRLRLEQRWVGRLNAPTSEKANEYIYLNRLRYMPRLDVPIKGKFYAALYDEIFIGFGENIGENVFDQNRVGILAGYKAGTKFRVEAGFLNQTVQLGREVGGKNVFQYNNGMIINTYLNL